MSFCVAFGCNNQSRNNKTVSYHDFPKEKKQRDQWIAAIGRTEVPATGRLCSDHFSPECYKDYLKMKHFPELFTNQNIKRRLLPGAISTSEKRKRLQEHKQVSFSFVFQNFIIFVN